MSNEEKIKDLEAKLERLKQEVEWQENRKGKPTACVCSECNHEIYCLRSGRPDMRHPVGIYFRDSVEGHNHDNHLDERYTFECFCGVKEYWPRNECPYCSWTGGGNTPLEWMPHYLGHYVLQQRALVVWDRWRKGQ